MLTCIYSLPRYAICYIKFRITPAEIQNQLTYVWRIVFKYLSVRPGLHINLDLHTKSVILSKHN